MSVIFKKFNYNKNDILLWNKFLLKNDENLNLAFNPSLSEIISENFNISSSYYFIYNSDNLIGLIPGFIHKNKFISMPVMSSAGLLLEKNYDKKKIFYEFINFINKDFVIKDFEPLSHFYYSIKKTVLLKLKNNVDQMLFSFRSKLRSDIRKSLKNNLEFIISDVNSLEDFYLIYSKSLHRLGTPVNSLKYFNIFFKNYEFGNKKIFLVKNDNKTIAACIVFSYNNVIEIFWAATNSNFNYLKPNVFMYWNLIKYSIENNFNYFSFGRSSKKSGSLKFKKQWDTKDNDLLIKDIFVSSNKLIKESNYYFITNLWKIIPYKLTKILGPIIRSKIIN